MALDLLARSLAASARAIALAATAGEGALPALAQFADLPLRTIPSGALRIEAAVGGAQGTYIADALATAALAAAHPLFCKASANGRYFRLLPVGGAIDIAQGGASGSGNQIVPLRAAIAYAAAVGIGAVLILQDCELWQPAKPGGSPDPYGGIMLTITGNVALIGREGGSTLTLKDPVGANRSTASGADATWWDGFILYNGAAVTESVLRNLIVRGTSPFANLYSNGESNIYDKGVLMNESLVPNLVRVDHRNVELTDFAGEIWYMGGVYSSCKVHVENLTLLRSPQSAWNPGTLARVVAVNLVAGETYQPCETIMGAGHDYYGGRFFNTQLGQFATFIGTEFFASGYYYSYINRNAASSAWTTFHGTTFHRVSPRLLSYARGSIVVVDGTIQVEGDCRDVQLNVQYILDSNNNSALIDMSGPATATTAFPFSPAGTYFGVPRNVRLDVVLSRTNRAETGGFLAHGLSLNSGLLDAGSIQVTLAGGPYNELWRIQGTPVAGYKVPRVVVRDVATGNQPFGGNYDYPVPDGTSPTDLPAYRIAWAAHVFYPGGADTFNVTLDNAYGYADGQEVMFIHGGGGSADRIMAFARNGTGMLLPADRTLRRSGEFLRLRWSALAGKWSESQYLGQGA